MTKDNLIFAVFGLLLGFVAAWLMFEKVTMLQPQRAMPGQTLAGTTGAAPAAPPGGMPGQQGPSPNVVADMMSRLEQIQEMVRQNPDNPQMVLELAHTSYDIAKQVPNPAGSRPLWMQARDSYKRYVELRPDDPEMPDILSDLGVTHQELGEFDEALEVFRRVQEIAPDHWQSLYNQVVVLAFNKKDVEGAKKVLAELLRVQPNNPDVQGLAQAVEAQRNAA